MKRDVYADSIRHLSSLGFTDLEALVYSCLVELSAATGYQVAHAIGKPVANTYKALQALEEKGAVIIDVTGESRSCRALPPTELLQRLTQDFEQQRSAAERSLASLRAAEPAAGVFALKSVEQVLERFERMVEKAEDIVLLDAFPAIMEKAGPILEQAAARGVVVVLHAYAEITLRGVDTVVVTTAEETLQRWTDEWICLVVDGSEYLFAYIDRQGNAVRQAIWSDSAFISWAQHSYLGSALRGEVLEQAVLRGASREELQAAFARSDRWSSMDVRGYRELVTRFAEDVTRE